VRTSERSLATVRLENAASPADPTDAKRTWSRTRQVVVAGNAALQERELREMSALLDALTSAS
jgi:hypothetical protein